MGRASAAAHDHEFVVARSSDRGPRVLLGGRPFPAGGRHRHGREPRQRPQPFVPGLLQQRHRPVGVGGRLVPGAHRETRVRQPDEGPHRDPHQTSVQRSGSRLCQDLSRADDVVRHQAQPSLGHVHALERWSRAVVGQAVENLVVDRQAVRQPSLPSETEAPAAPAPRPGPDHPAQPAPPTSAPSRPSPRHGADRVRAAPVVARQLHASTRRRCCRSVPMPPAAAARPRCGPHAARPGSPGPRCATARERTPRPPGRRPRPGSGRRHRPSRRPP